MYKKSPKKLGKMAGEMTAKGRGKLGGTLLAKRNKAKSYQMRKGK